MIKQFYETLTGTTTPNQSEPEGDGNKEEFHIPQISWTGASPSDAVLCHTQDAHWGVTKYSLFFSIVFLVVRILLPLV